MSNSNSVANVSTAKPKVGGSVFRSALPVTLPTDAVSDIADSFENVGYISDAGIVASKSVTVQTVKAWGGDTVLVTKQSTDRTYQFTMLEVMNTEALKVYHGDDNVSGTLASGITIRETSEEDAPHAWIIDSILNGGVLQRRVIPNAVVTAYNDVNLVDSGAMGYGVTLTAIPDATGATGYTYIKKPA